MPFLRWQDCRDAGARMSIRLMNIVWSTPWPSQSALLIALKMADHADDDGNSIHPSRTKLAKHALTSLATVRRTIAGFRTVGLLKVVAEGGKGPKSTTRYTMDLGVLMRLHDGYAELQRAEDAEDGFVLVAKAPDEDCGKEAGHHDPLNQLSGSPESLSGSPAKISGSIDGPRTTTLEPPSRTSSARAREDSNFDLKVKKSFAAFEVTSSDVSWRDWMRHLGQINRSDLVDAATAAGRMTVAARWPKADTPLPVIPQAGLTERSKAMAGEGA